MSKSDFDSNPTMLYRGERYGVGDYLNMAFHRGNNGTLISREDSGRVILLEEGYTMDIAPRDVVSCIVVCVKSETAPDWTGHKRNGFSIVRPIKIVEKKEQVERRELREHPPLGSNDIPESEDSEEDSQPEPKTATVVAIDTPFEQLGLEFGEGTVNVRGYTQLVEFVTTLSVYDAYSQLRWNAKYLTDAENKILLKLLNTEVLLSVIDVTYKKSIIPPFTARVQSGFVTVPHALLEYTNGYSNRKVLLRVYELAL